MKIDRTRFLVLTGALSAAACVASCTVVNHPANPPTPPPAPPHAVGPATPGGAVVMHQPGTPGAAAEHPGPHSPIVFRMPALGPFPSPAPSPSACLDSGATTAPSCVVSCTSNPFMAQRCAVYASHFDPKVAAAAVACMNGLTGAAACDSMQAYNCGKNALTQACPDPTVDQLCQIASTPCKIAQNDCITMVSGLSSPGQDAVATCISQGCSAGLYSCIEGLSATSSASAVRR